MRWVLTVQEWATAKWGAECYERIDNSVPAAQRHATVQRFNEEGRCDRHRWTLHCSLVSNGKMSCRPDFFNLEDKQER